MTNVYFVRHAQPNYENHDDLTRELTEKGLQDRKLVTEFLRDKEVSWFLRLNILFLLPMEHKTGIITKKWEADLLENLMVMDKEKEQEKIKKCIGENFKTNTGKRIAYNRFILD